MAKITTGGMDCAAAAAEAEKQMAPAPASVYKLNIAEVEQTVSKKGRPMLVWKLEIVGAPNPDLNGKKIRYSTIDPSDGNTSGIGFLCDICNAAKMPFGTDGFDTDEYHGKVVEANVVVSSDGKWNEVDSFIS